MRRRTTRNDTGMGSEGRHHIWDLSDLAGWGLALKLLPVMALASVGVGTAEAADQHDLHTESKEARPIREGATRGADRSVESTKSETAEEWTPVIYIPPSRGQARNQAAGGTRTLSNTAVDLQVAVLAPKDHVALTTRAQPTLYWFVSADTGQRIDLTIVDDESIDPLLEMTLPGPITEGIHALELAEVGLSLEPERTYRWHVAIVKDAKRRSTDTLAEGFIQRMPASEALEKALLEARSRYAPYALAGIWYDAMDELQSAIALDPDNPRLALQRRALLEQAELTDVASYARRDER